MNIPTIGGARGIFEIFVPGVFMLLNLGFSIYLFPFVDDKTREFIVAVASNSVLSLILLVVFGYLIGVIIRLSRAELPDSASSWWLRTFRWRNVKDVENSEDTHPYWVVEKFPYINWLGEVCKRYLPSEALDFYNKVWAPRKQEGINRAFFNYCKILINSADERAANEIYAAESLTRYVVGMFYSLVYTSILLVATLILRFLITGELLLAMIIILLVYLFAILGILRHFRFLRIKEVETVFTASFRNKHLFLLDEKNKETEDE